MQSLILKSKTEIPDKKDVYLITEGSLLAYMTRALTQMYKNLINMIDDLLAFEQARIKIHNAQHRHVKKYTNKNNDLEFLQSSYDSSSTCSDVYDKPKNAEGKILIYKPTDSY